MKKNFTEKERKIIAIIKAYGTYDAEHKRYELRLQDMAKSPEIIWTFWDDDIEERTDENGFEKCVDVIFFDEYNIFVKYTDTIFANAVALSTLDYEDDDNNNFADYIVECLEDYFDLPFDYEVENKREDFVVMTINRDDLRDSDIDEWDEVDDVTMECIASKMSDYMQSSGEWRSDLRDACDFYDVH